MDIEEFWAKTNSLIKERKTTQRAVSKTCGLAERRIETMVSTKRLPNIFIGCHIAKALGVTVEYLVTGADGLTADERELLAAYRRIDDNNKAAAVGSVAGIAAAYPKGGDALSSSVTA